MIRTHIREVVRETKTELVFCDSSGKQIRIKNPMILELREGKEKNYTRA